MLARLAALVLCILALVPAARAQDNAYPINGEDGTPVLNHKVPEDALADRRSGPFEGRRV